MFPELKQNQIANNVLSLTKCHVPDRLLQPPGVVMYSSYSPPGVPVAGVRLATVNVILSLFFLSSPHFSHCVIHKHALTPSVCCCCSPFSSASFQTSLTAVLPLHSRSSSPPFSLHFLGICSLCQFFISHSLHVSGPFEPTLHQFLVKMKTQNGKLAMTL